jgi:hypothetical protein
MMRISKRFFSERRLLKLEQDAAQNQSDLKAQRQLFKELLSTQNYKRLQQKFENPSLPPISTRYSKETRLHDIERIQTDPVILDAYIHALVLDGKGSIVDKVVRFMDSKKESVEPQTITESQPHWMKTDMEQWQRAIDTKQPSSQYSSSRRGIPKKDEPIQVVLSEAWSWSKLARNFESKIFYGILVLTGLSVVLEQQGILKSGTLD